MTDVHTETPFEARAAAPEVKQGNEAARRLALGQGIFFVVSGVWPILHMRSFEAVTGPKVDRWLVKTVGALITVGGGALIAAARRGRVTREIAFTGAGMAAALAAIDVWYAGMRGRISKVYLLDALVELGLAGAWAIVGSDDDADRAT
jgi:hypothetical protein